MLEIFQNLVNLYGYPGDSQLNWAELVQKSKEILTEEEFKQAKRWVFYWTAPLQIELRSMTPQ